MRARAAGLRGYYIPDMFVRHIVPGTRLNKHYFRRWFYWRGISRAKLYSKAGLDMEAPEQTALDFASVPHVLGVPRYLYRKALLSVARSIRARLAGDPVGAFEQELWVWFFAGILRQRWKDRGLRSGKARGVASEAPSRPGLTLR